MIDEKFVEVKSVRKLLDVHEAQLLNYLKATPYEVGLLLNFGREADVQRRVYDNDKSLIFVKTKKSVSSVFIWVPCFLLLAHRVQLMRQALRRRHYRRRSCRRKPEYTAQRGTVINNWNSRVACRL